MIQEKNILSRRTIGLFLIVACVCMFLTGCSYDVNPDRSAWRVSYDYCFPCVLYEAVFSAMDRIVLVLMYRSCELGRLVLGIGLLFWMAFESLKLLSFKAPNLKEYVQRMSTTFFKAIIIGTALAFPEVYAQILSYYIIQPIFLLIGDISRRILTSNTLVASKLLTAEEITGSLQMDDIQSLFGTSVTYILDIIYRIFAGLYMGLGLGVTILVSGPGFMSLILGLAIIWMFIMLLLMLPINFIDGFVQLGALLIVSPFMFVAWVFPIKLGQDILKKAWSTLLGAMLNLMFTCIYVAIMLYVILVFSSRNMPGIFGEARQTMDPVLELDVKTFSTRFIGFCMILLCFYFLAGKIPAIVKQFSGTAAPAGGLAKWVMAKVKAGQTAAMTALGAKTVSTAAALASKTANASDAKEGPKNE